MKIQTPLFVFLFFVFLGCKKNNDNSNPIKKTPLIDFEISNTFLHDTTAFTEGFLVHEGNLFESTGASQDFINSKSLFGKVDLNSGIIDPKVTLDRDKYFGEGIAFLNGKVFQLTYKTKVGFVYDAKSFEKIKEFTFPSEEGWGLTTDGSRLIMSDGTNILTFLDPKTLTPIKTLEITENGYSRDALNELEYINGYIYANIWRTNTIVKIDTKTGNVIGKLDLTSIANEAKNKYQGAIEMNGIAYDTLANKIYVTGKFWPTIYEIKFNH